MPTGFRLHKPSLSSAQRSDIVAAMKEWESQTRMDFLVQTSSSHPDPSGSRSAGGGWSVEGNLIWEGEIPVDWPSYSRRVNVIATTRFLTTSQHLDYSGDGIDTVFRSRWDFTPSSTLNDCLADYNNADAADKDGDTGSPYYDNRDQKSTALHEMGHWIVLNHFADRTSIMYPYYFDGYACQWNVYSADSARAATKDL